MTTVWIPWSTQRVENAITATIQQEIDWKILSQLGEHSNQPLVPHNKVYLELCEQEWLQQQQIVVDSIEVTDQHKFFGLQFRDHDAALLFVLTWQPKGETWLIDE